MFKKNLRILFLYFFCGMPLISGNVPYLSQHQHLAQNDEESLLTTNEVKKEGNEDEKNKSELPLASWNVPYLSHQHQLTQNHQERFLKAKEVKKPLYEEKKIKSGLPLVSWNVHYLSRQQHLIHNDEPTPLKTQEAEIEEKENKRNKKSSLKAHYRCAYQAHQKNRLAYFADHDGFIWFDDKDNKYTFFLSNFYPTNIKIWGMKFYCSEAAVQAAKFLDKPALAVRFTHLDGEDAWKLAQKLSYQQRGDWYQVRESLMLDVLRAKFQQHPELSDLLLATGDAYLAENTERDAFWADGGDGKGKNRLGHLLMQVRGEKGGIGVVPKPAKYKKFVD